jgi:hypothetical protein
MPKTVVALYDDFDTALAVIHALVENRFSKESISLIASEASGSLRQPHLENASESELETVNTGFFEHTDATGGAAVGAGVGAAAGGLGGLLLGLSAFVIPGIGPAIAAGPLASTLSGLIGAGAGAAAGGIMGGLLGVLSDSGVPEQIAHYYAEGLRRGGNLVVVRTRTYRAPMAVEIMDEFGPVDLNQRVLAWQESEITDNEPEKESPEAITDESITGSETQTQEVVVPRENPFPEETGLNTYEARFKDHFNANNYADQYQFKHYLPVYRFGYQLATNSHFKSQSWSEIEPLARKYWEEKNPGTWGQVQDVIKYAWEETNR